ncbi:hypothetical protein HELRODRAFT_64159, partial [Helobdella robusta]|uniref:G-protein coupled receptors family 1 profile domain-containing protein n=1 Tax=Helobdella robusta TaxID=6412 RepID=T1FXQ4_HELRO
MAYNNNNNIKNNYITNYSNSNIIKNPITTLYHQQYFHYNTFNNKSLINNIDSIDFVNVSFSNSSNISGNGAAKINSNEDDVIPFTSSGVVKIIFIFVYSAIFTVGSTGNFLVIFVVLRRRSMHTITNIFIANLALSDILMCLLAVPFTPISIFTDDWKFGRVLCHLVPMTSGVSVHVSTLTSTAIAIDRFFVIVHPFKPKLTVKLCLMLTAAIWMSSVSISMPLGTNQKIFTDTLDNTSYCQEHWSQSTSRQFFTVTSLVLQYIVPCTVITYCYVKVSLCLKARCRLKIGAGRTKNREEMELKRNRRTNKMLIAMVSIFVCCWLPLNVLFVLLDLEIIILSTTNYSLVFLIVHVIAMSSTVYNPFLYGWMNENFQKEFATVLPKCF